MPADCEAERVECASTRSQLHRLFLSSPSRMARPRPSEAVQPPMPTIGRLRGTPPIEPWKAASPKLKMPPSEATSQ